MHELTVGLVVAHGEGRSGWRTSPSRTRGVRVHATVLELFEDISNRYYILRLIFVLVQNETCEWQK
jgi:hypothetical protein